MKSLPLSRFHFRGNPAFSLIELLAVVALMGILAAMAVPAFSGNGRDMSRAADSMTDIFQQARTRAMSKNTYVYVGLAVTDEPTPKLAVAVVEARNGLSSKTNDLAANPASAAVQPISRPVFLRGVQLNTTTADDKLSDNFIPAGTGTQVVKVEDSLIRFPSELVSPGGNISGSEFAWVIQFSPDGAARLDTTRRTVPDYIVLGLVPARGDAENAVGVVIDGASGVVRVVRNGA